MIEAPRASTIGADRASPQLHVGHGAQHRWWGA